ncbi:ZIP-like iron-zinc transporter [Cristinia sonorae]|uniref:ZIP-like iron-zinc transporter n=1 Tax=Cristinia sonorae TaxID=1940300 RepID=A0A8K0UUG9_9AGAR|nr:ZIP-like iron-zinc transporter [Cristinia sonorae]
MTDIQNRILSRRNNGGGLCGDGSGADTFFPLRVASIFIILIASLIGALLPFLSHRSTWLKLSPAVYGFAKYFGSGVIIATAFMNLLDSAIFELQGPCLDSQWVEYPYALVFTLLSIFASFILEIVAFRWGSTRLVSIGVTHVSYGHGMSSHTPCDSEFNKSDVEKLTSDSASVIATNFAVDPAAHLLGIAIMEFGILLHSVLIGLTLAVAADFKILLLVIVFHQAFEGLAIGSRLAHMGLPKKYTYVAIIGVLLYGIAAPVGLAVGLAVHSIYNPFGATASLVSGIFNSISAGIFIYTGLVRFFAHDFLFSKEMMNSSNGKIIYTIGCMLLGCGITAVLSRWS